MEFDTIKQLLWQLDRTDKTHIYCNLPLRGQSLLAQEGYWQDKQTSQGECHRVLEKNKEHT